MGVPFLFVCALLAVTLCVVGSDFFVRLNMRRKRLAEGDSKSSSASPQKSTTRCLITRGDVAPYVSDLRSLASDWRLTTITRLDWLGDCSVFYATSESLGLAVRTYLLEPLRTSLTPRQFQSLANELRQADQESGGE